MTRPAGPLLHVFTNHYYLSQKILPRIDGQLSTMAVHAIECSFGLKAIVQSRSQSPEPRAIPSGAETSRRWSPGLCLLWVERPGEGI